MVAPAWADHAYALWGQPKYPQGFARFDYVNPQAPKGGELRLVSNLRTSTFDKYNPFTLRGSAPAYLSDLMFDSLLTGALDETGAAHMVDVTAKDLILGTIGQMGTNGAAGHVVEYAGAALRAMSYVQRGALLAAVVKVLQAHRDDYYAISTANSGTVKNDTAVDVDGGIYTLGYYRPDRCPPHRSGACCW